jgi:hypothetical protein
MNPALLIGSLAGVLGLAAAAWLLGLGGGTIGDEADARLRAEESHVGFTAQAAVRSSDGQTAAVLGSDGSVILLKVHGARIAARHVTPPLAVRRDGNTLRIASGDPRFGDIRLVASQGAWSVLSTSLADHSRG